MKSVDCPDNWQQLEFGALVKDIGDGGTPPRNKPEYFSGDVNWCTVTDIKHFINDTEEKLSTLGLRNSSAKLWPENSVILSTGATIGQVGIAKVRTATKQGITGIVLKEDKADANYIYYLLSSLTNLLQRYSQGSTFKEIRPPLLSRIPVLVPPLPEQRKIAAILSTVDETIERTDAIIEETQQLKKGLMQKLFTEGIGHTRFRKTILADVEKPIAQRGHQLKQFRILPQDWDIVRCGKVFSLEYGKGLTESGRDGGDFPVVGSAGIVGHHSQKLVVGPGMVVGRKGGAGIVTHVKDDFWPIDTTYFVKLTGKHDLDWLYYILNFMKLTKLGEGTVPGLNRTDVYNLYIPLPPLPEQRQIAEILSEVDSKIETEHAFKSELEQLKKGLMQVLLTGKVRVKV